MKLEDLLIQPFGKSLDPCMAITFKLVTERPFNVPIRYVGHLFCGQFRVAVLDDYNFEHSNDPDIGALKDYDGYDKTFEFNKVFTADFSAASLKKIEESRNKKGDIELDLRIKVYSLKSEIGTYRIEGDIEESYDLVAIKYGKLLRHNAFSFNQNYRITSSDWIHDFVPVFNNLKYQVFEIPQPELLNTETEVKLKLKEAIDALPFMMEARSKGEWNQVIKESRPIWELVNNKADLEDTFRGQLNNDTWGSLKDLIQSFFTFSSKFIHRLSQNKELMEVNNASKSDAELVYAMAFSIVNFISNKLR